MRAHHLGFLPKDALPPAYSVKNLLVERSRNRVSMSRSAIASCLIKKHNTQIPNFFNKSGDLI